MRFIVHSALTRIRRTAHRLRCSIQDALNQWTAALTESPECLTVLNQYDVIAFGNVTFPTIA